MKEEWLSNEELYRAHDTWIEGSDEEKAYKAELERRLKLSGFFDMPLEFYLREIDGRIVPCEDGFECRASSMVFIGKTALEAAKMAYGWMFGAKPGSKAWLEQQTMPVYVRPNPLDSLI